jgi:hypothetical protein
MRFISCLILLLCSAVSTAQDREGIILSNYHPVTGTYFNPSASVDSRAFIQVNLVGVNAGVYTNLLYLQQFSVIKTAQNPVMPQIKPVSGTKSKFLHLQALADGPSFYCSTNKYGFGFFTRGRAVADFRRIPYQFTSFIFDGQEPAKEPEFSVRNGRMSEMSWLEYGLNFGYMVKRRRYDLFTAGINIKYLTGLNLQYLNLKRLDGTSNDVAINISQIEGVYKAVDFAFGSGKGLGTDMGFTYKRMLKEIDTYVAHSKQSSSNCKIVDYKFKVGVSLRDLGYISFKKGTNTVQLVGSGTIYQDGKVEEQIRAKFSVDEASQAKTRALLPFALALNGDYNLGYSFYIGAALQKGLLPNGSVGVLASDFVAIAPRFETRHIEVAIPFSLKRFNTPELGLALRIRSFVIGVDNLLPMIASSNTRAAGVYFNLGWTLFKNPKCGEGAGKIDDCSKDKKGSVKIKRKNSLLSAFPLKEKKQKRPVKKGRRFLFFQK